MERAFWRIAMEDLLREVNSGHNDPVRLHKLITRAETAVLSRYFELSERDDSKERNELGVATKEILKLQTGKLG
jgi:hypothetical protein